MDTIDVDPARNKRLVNDMMRDGLRAQSPRAPIPFFCECDSAACHEVVWRTKAQYDEERAATERRLLAHF